MSSGAVSVSAELRSILNAAGTMIIATDLDGIVQIFNPAAERLLGWSAAEVVGQQTPALWHDAEEVAARAAELSQELDRTVSPGFEVFVAKARDQINEQRQWTYIRKDGSRFPVQLVVSAIRDAAGTITGYVGTAQNLTERVRAEEELDQFFDQSQDLLCICGADGYFKRINPAFHRVLGWTDEEILARPFIEFVHAEDRIATLLEVEKLATGKPTLHFENRYHCKDGSWRWLAWTSTPQADGTLYASARDVTYLKQSEEALERLAEERTTALVASVARYDSLARVSPVGIIMFDAARKCVDVNDRWCEMTDSQREDALGDGWYEVVHPEDRERVVRRWTSTVQRSGGFYSEHRLRPKDGHTAWVICLGEQITNSLGEVTGYIRTMTDVTQQKQTERALRLLSTDLASLSGAAFYEAVVRQLAELVNCEMAFICRRDPAAPDQLVTVAVFTDGEIQPNFSYSAAGTPCENVAGGRNCVIPSGAWEKYPRDVFLKDHQIEAYVGVPNTDNQGRQIGHIGVMSRRILATPETVETIANLFAVSVVAEMERQASERRFADLFEHSPDAVVITNSDGIIVQANRQVATLFGWTPNELVGQPIELLMPADLRAAHPSLRERYLKSALPRAMGSGRTDLLGLRRDGSVFPVEISLSPMETPEGLLVAAAVRDVTERQRAQELLRNSEAQYRELFESSSDAVMVLSPQTGKFGSGNPAALRMFGVGDQQEFRGLAPEALSPPQQPDGRPSAEAAAELIDQALCEGSAFFEWTHKRFNGEPFPATVLLTRMELAGQPMLQATVRDITKQVTLERQSLHQTRLAKFSAMVGMALAEKGDLRRALHHCTEAIVEYLDAAFARIWTLNDEEQILELQASSGMYTHIDGPHARVPVGMYIIGLIAQERQAHLTNDVYTDPRVSDKQWARREGLTAFAGYPLLVEDRVVGVVAMFSHETLGETILNSLRSVSNAIAQHIDRKHAETALAQLNATLENRISQRTQELAAVNKELFQASQAKSEFLATMSHELRTPLNGILGMNELLLTTELNDRQRQYVEACNSSGKILVHLVNDILDLAKIESGKLELDPRECDLEALTYDVMDIMLHAARQKGLTLNCHVAPEACVVGLCDDTRLRQVLVNLIGNAVKFTSAGSITVAVDRLAQKKHTSRLRFTILDTGIGIPAARLDRLFKAFSQVDSTITRQFGGTGLGLSICKQIIELMGGEISVESQVGVGTTFWFDIEIPIIEGKSIAERRRQLLARTTIIVVDGLDRDRRQLGESLSSWNCPFQQVASIEEAVSAAQAGHAADRAFQVALVDLRAATGIEFVELEKLAALPNVHIIGLGSPPDALATEHLFRLGIRLVLSDPIRPSTLFNALKSVLSVTNEIMSRVEDRATQLQQAMKTLSGHILVAEDNRINQLYITELLKHFGCTSDVVSNGEEVLAQAEQKPYDLILMDCQMPEMDGFTATREIRKREAAGQLSGRLPIVALTANALKGDRERCLAAGMDEYISKPVEGDQLRAILERFLGR